MDSNISEKELNDVVNLLDQMAQSDSGRYKITMSDDIEKGSVEKIHHHGRCDIGSPWACGTPFDILEVTIQW